MPTHDWTRVAAGTWHDFHLAWIAELRNTLNGGVLPGDYYAMAELIVGPMGPDVLTLQSTEPRETGNGPGEATGGLALAVAPPRPRLVGEAEGVEQYLHKQRQLVIRHSSGDRMGTILRPVIRASNRHESHPRGVLRRSRHAGVR